MKEFIIITLKEISLNNFIVNNLEFPLQISCVKCFFLILVHKMQFKTVRIDYK